MKKGNFQKKANENKDTSSSNPLNTKSVVSKKGDSKISNKLPVFYPGESNSLALDLIKIHEDNPRTAPNRKYDEIKHSIITNGFRDTLSITLIPGEDKFTLFAGSGTRFKILVELYEETKDEKYKEVRIVFFPYTSETGLLFNGWSENAQREPLCFIDNAVAIVKAKKLYEKLNKINLTVRKTVEVLTDVGYTNISKSSVTDMIYAVDHVEPKIPLLSRSHKIKENDSPGIGSRIVADIRKYYLASEKSYLHASVSHKKEDWYDIYFSLLSDLNNDPFFDIETFKLSVVKHINKSNPNLASDIEESFEVKKPIKATSKLSNDLESNVVDIETKKPNKENRDDSIDTVDESNDNPSKIENFDDAKNQSTKPISNESKPSVTNPEELNEKIYKNIEELTKETSISSCFKRDKSGVGFSIKTPSKKTINKDAALWWILHASINSDLSIDSTDYKTWELKTKSVINLEIMTTALSVFMKNTNDMQLSLFHIIQADLLRLNQLTNSDA